MRTDFVRKMPPSVAETYSIFARKYRIGPAHSIPDKSGIEYNSNCSVQSEALAAENVLKRIFCYAPRPFACLLRIKERSDAAT